HLQPLAIAINVLQSTSCRLDTVIVTFGFLVMQYKHMIDPLVNHDYEHDLAGCQHIVASLEKRWAKADQGVFIAALILNPLHGISLLSSSSMLSQGRLSTLLSHLYQRFFLTPPPNSFSLEISDYFERKDRYADLDQVCQTEMARASREKRDEDPMNVFKSLLGLNEADTPLIKLAQHLFAISTNSASCKRLFSVFGNLLTKLRNRLGLENMKSIAELRMRLNDDIRNSTNTHTRMKQHFGHGRDGNSGSGRSLSLSPLFDRY
ncbi:hypothetical protein BKA70DRAFT_1129969, partial [Coprinopsis sp. MPI-PUGE-AT-0042]